LSRNARKNLNRAKTVPFEFVRLNARDDAQVARAYEVIKTNRESRGYPLRMSLDDVLRTIRIIDADFFVLTLDGVDVAAAQVFHVADGIAQVVYWGDVPGYGEMRPMNMLSYCLFEHYRNNGIKVLDIGPSTEHGEPNYGLCEFKENLGCEISLKHTFTLSI
jgi:lipid II:glycine glycyltransferase (peptidoglycan interpeptide bridge formation enzyme)